MLTLALIALIQAPQDAAAFEDPAKEIQWAHTFDEAFELAALRNVPVWIFLTSDNWGPCQALERGAFKDPKFVKALNDACVPVVYVTSYKNWPTADVKSGKELVKRSSEFPRLAVEELQALRKQTPEELQKIGSFSTPNYLVLNASKERVAAMLDRKVSTDGVLAALADCQKKLGAGAGVAIGQEFAKALKNARETLDGDDMAKAVKAVAALDKLKGLSAPMTKAAEEIKAKLVEKGEEKIAEIEAYVDPAAVREDLAKLADAFKGHALEKKIREKLKK